MLNVSKRGVALIGLLVLLAGCNSTPKVKKQVVMAPKEAAMANVRTLGIASVNGRHGNGYRANDDNIRAKVSTFLAGVSAPGKPGFTLVDNQKMQAIIDHQRRTESSQYDSDTAIRLGKLTGADSLINFDYFISAVKDERYNKDYTDYDTCVKYKKDGKKCKEYKRRTESCTKRKISVELNPTVVDVTSGSILLAKTYTSNRVSKKCPSKGNTLATSEEMVTASFDEIFTKMRKDIYFYPLVLELKLIESDDSDMPKKAEMHLENAIEFVEQDMVDRACKQIQKAAATYSESPAIMYNMGICQDIKGNKDVAKGFFEKALEYKTYLDSSDKELVYSAIRRMEGKEDLDKHNEKQKTTLGSLFN